LGDGENFVGADLGIERNAFQKIEAGAARGGNRGTGGGGDASAGIQIAAVKHFGAVELAIKRFAPHLAFGGIIVAGVAIALWIFEGNSERATALECERHLAADADADSRIGAAAGVVEKAPDPALSAGDFG